MRVLVTGSRTWADTLVIRERLSQLPDDAIVIHGDAMGADRIADAQAVMLGLLTERHPALWERYGKRAGFIRNQEMVDAGADLVLAFWDGESKGTAHTIEMAKTAGIPVEVIRGVG